MIKVLKEHNDPQDIVDKLLNELRADLHHLPKVLKELRVNKVVKVLKELKAHKVPQVLKELHQMPDIKPI